MAVPKRKVSRANTRSRRANHDKIAGVNTAPCPNPECGAPKLSHQVCWNCGEYRGRQILARENVEVFSEPDA